MKMKKHLIYFCLLVFINKSKALWDKDTDCPHICTCRLEHLSETAIYRFMQKDKESQPGVIGSVENNDVFYEESLDAELFEDKSIVKSATCILQTETDPLQLLEKIPKDIETLTLIQGYESGNKSIKFSYLSEFKQLLSLELLGPNVDVKKSNQSYLICEIDMTIDYLKFLNLERILIEKSKVQLQKFLKEYKDEEVTFAYVVKLDDESHPLTFIQKDNEPVLPYEKISKSDLNEYPLFLGFKSLFFLRISNCELNNVYWEMFDGLSNLEYLILERNNLKFIPAFAFYGTPSLKTLSLAHNNLLDIQLTDLAGLLELQYLDLSYNNFSQLSELSLPPFPKLKLANFGNNPISVIFPNTFEVMNTTDSLVIGSDDMPLSLTMNSFLGLNLLKKLTLRNIALPILKRELLVGMPNLLELIFTGNISKLDFDAFVEVYNLELLVLNDCKITNVSMDAFMGLLKLQYLDLSSNQLDHLPSGVFDKLSNLKELYLNGNKFQFLPREIFSRIHPKLIRLNENPWHCSCQMSDWKPMIANKIKQKVFKPCYANHDKGLLCTYDNKFMFKYVYDNKVAPKCVEPKQFQNWSVFLAMRKLLKCKEFKPRFKKHNKSGEVLHSSQVKPVKSEEIQIIQTQTVKTIIDEKDYYKMKMLRNKLNRAQFKKKMFEQKGMDEKYILIQNNTFIPNTI
ncbi:unnamed protein product [Brassicogethes aeneus]|uniref:Uncharacterized protein n=1 Tax=Brassicogethes aeneus TaxID=1431903 RepID=A0A9P0BHZ0_BRAAE|nr:unnamed protein product [Brassicogethes aeneus]